MLLLILFLGIIQTSIAIYPRSGFQCQTQEDCLDDGWEFCNFKDEQSGNEEKEIFGECKHKSVFPIKELEFWGLMIVMMIVWITNMGGIGGAGLVVPISQAFFKFDAKNAIALSNISICLSAAIRFVSNSQRPHPLKDGKGTLIDVNLSTIFFPLMVSGVSFGVILNIMMPPMVVIFFYVAIQFYLGILIFKKNMKLYKDEQKILQNQNGSNTDVNASQIKTKITQVSSIQLNVNQVAEKSEINSDSYRSDQNSRRYIIDNKSENSNQFLNIPKTNEEILKQKQDDEQNLQQIENEENTYFQLRKISSHWIIILILILFSLLRGGNQPSDSIIRIKRCDNLGWYLFIGLQIICMVFFYYSVYIIKKDQNQKNIYGYQYREGDIEINNRNLFIMFLIGFVGSLFAGFAGIGPAMIYCPALIMLGLEARVATATASYMAFLTTLSSSIQVLILKRIQMDYAFHVILMTILGSFPGLFFQHYMVNTYKRVSLQVFIFTASIFIAAIITFVVNIPILISKHKLDADIFFISEYCTKST